MINEKKESTRIIPKKQEETEANPAVDTIITYRGRNFNISGIGCGINTIKDSPIIDNIIIRNDILDANFFNLKIKEKNPYITNTCNVLYESGNSINEVNKKISAKYGAAIDASIKVNKLFNLSASSNFSFGIDVSKKNYAQSYFYHAHAINNRYRYSLPNTSDLDTYSSHLSDVYIKALNQAIKNNNYFPLFDNFGTHIIMGGTFGGLVDAYYKLESNSLDLNIDSNFSASRKAETSITKKLSAIGGLSVDVEESLDIMGEYRVSENNTEESFTAKSYGGKGFSCTNVNQVPSKIDEWISSVNNEETLINFDEIVPLWKLVPNNISNRELVINNMKESFENYSEIYSIYSNDYDFNPKKPTVSNYLIRKDQDLSVGANETLFEPINLAETGAKPSIMKKVGYDKVKITLKLKYSSNKYGKKAVYVKTKNKNELYNYLTGISLNRNPSYSSYYSQSTSFYVNINQMIDSDELFLIYDGDVDFKTNSISLEIEYSLC